MQNKTRSFLITIAAALSFLLAACQPQPTVESVGLYTLQITQIDTTDFPLIDVYVSVQNENGEPVIINTEKIQLLENGQPVPNQDIQGASDAGPLTTILLMDNSGSMNYADKLVSAKEVAKEYVDQMRAGDQVGVITFNTEVVTVQEITNDQEALASAIDSITAGSDTALYDALVYTVDTVNPLPGRKAIIVLTDGMDVQSTATPDEALARIGFGGLSISTVGFGQVPEEGEDADDYAGIDEITLQYMADNAGGDYGYAENREQLFNIYNRIRRALQSEVVISYTTPLSLRDGVLRALTVKLADRYVGVGGESQTQFNPGGLVPEVAQPASWLLFAIILAVLVLLLLVPIVLRMIRNQKPAKKKKVKITLKD
jgi:Ca-activated chloride channel homolog